MIKKTLATLGSALLATTLFSHASVAAGSDAIELAKKQEQLSIKIATSYAEHKDISQVLHRLEDQQLRLKRSIHDPEISNMIDFLQLCLENISDISLQPRSDKNLERIADLGASINEGSRYIVRKLN